MANAESSLSTLITETDAGIVHSPEWLIRLKEAIDYLLTHDFGKLVQVLYRADVSEQKLKQLLKDNPATDASAIISRMLLERQIQKIETRKSFSSASDNSEGEERW